MSKLILWKTLKNLIIKYIKIIFLILFIKTLIYLFIEI